MKIIGIICEYNPFHLGHKKQIDTVRHLCGMDSIIVCLMSGNFVQRGEPAIFDKALRARAAVACGADLVLELPVTYALSSAEGFAAGGVKILSGFCDGLCFGTESGTAASLMDTAQALRTPEFSEQLRCALETGCSFPAARQKALDALGLDSSLLQNPNDILAIEYCKAILTQGVGLEILPIRREGSYHSAKPDPENPSATALRGCIFRENDWSAYVPAAAHAVFSQAPVHTLQAGERAVLARLRTMSDSDFAALPYGSEGLWRRFMHACRQESSIETILSATKSKRYARTRLNRMLMCAFLGLSASELAATPPYVRVLAFRDTGCPALKKARETGSFPHIGEVIDDPWWKVEQRVDDLYGLFREIAPSPAGQAKQRRVYIQKKPTA